MRNRTYVIILICIGIFATSCAGMSGRNLRTAHVDDPATISGTYTLIVIGGTHGEDVKNIAVIDREGDSLEFQPYVSEYDYYKVEHLAGQDALRQAVRAVNWHPSFSRVKIRGILDNAGNVIAYEIRPLFRPLEFGVADILDTNYSLKDNTVFVFLNFKRSLEERIQRDSQHHDK